jgi:TM2 domain-containing membrane protein YozV
MPASEDAVARLRYEAGRKSLPVAYLLWFLLGYGGVHRMYLGHWISGLLMLALLGVSTLFTIILVGYVGYGLIFIWWVLDSLLIPGMAQRSNDRLIDSLRH